MTWTPSTDSLATGSATSSAVGRVATLTGLGPLARLTAATTALGAGIAGVGVAGPVLRGVAAPLPSPVCVMILVVAAAQTGWAVTTLRTARTAAGHVAGVGSLVLACGWLATAVASPAGTHGGRVSAVLAAVLCAACAGAILLARRAGRAAQVTHPGQADETPASPWVHLAVLVPVTVLVAAAVTAALAASPAGDGAVNHMNGMHHMDGSAMGNVTHR